MFLKTYEHPRIFFFFISRAAAPSSILPPLPPHTHWVN